MNTMWAEAQRLSLSVSWHKLFSLNSAPPALFSSPTAQGQVACLAFLWLNIMSAPKWIMSLYFEPAAMLTATAGQDYIGNYLYVQGIFSNTRQSVSFLILYCFDLGLLLIQYIAYHIVRCYSSDLSLFCLDFSFDPLLTAVICGIIACWAKVTGPLTHSWSPQGLSLIYTPFVDLSCSFSPSYSVCEYYPWFHPTLKIVSSSTVTFSWILWKVCFKNCDALAGRFSYCQYKHTVYFQLAEEAWHWRTSLSGRQRSTVTAMQTKCIKMKQNTLTIMHLTSICGLCFLKSQGRNDSDFFLF